MILAYLQLYVGVFLYVCREQTLPTIQIQLQRDTSDYGSPVDLPPGNSTKSSGGLPKTISKLTSRFTKKTNSSNSSAGGSFSIPSTPSRSSSGVSDDKAGRLHSLLQMSSMNSTDPQIPNGAASDEQGMNLPTDQEMQDVIDFLSGFNMGKSQQASPLVKRRNSVASTNAADLKPPPSSQVRW